MKTKTQLKDFIITILFFANNKNNIYLILVQIQVRLMGKGKREGRDRSSL